MKNRTPWLLSALVVLGALVGVIATQAPSPRVDSQVEPATMNVSEVAPGQSANAQTGELNEAETQGQIILSEFPTPDVLRARTQQCLQVMLDAFPRGRLLKLMANALAQQCTAVVETDSDSGRFFGANFNYQSGTLSGLGEMRLPRNYGDAASLPKDLLSRTELSEADLAARIEELSYAEAQTPAWVVAVAWLPKPLAKSVWFVGYNDIPDFYWMTSHEDGDQAIELFPMMGEEAADAAALKDPVDVAADKSSALNLEGAAEASGSVFASAERCVQLLLQGVSPRLLRFTADERQCTVLVDVRHGADHWQLFQVGANGTETVHVALPDRYVPLPNYAIDPAWLRPENLRQRLGAQATAEQPKFVAIYFDHAHRDVIWHYEFPVAERGGESTLQLNRDGKPVQRKFPSFSGEALRTRGEEVIKPVVERQ